MELRVDTKWNYSYYPVIFKNEAALLKVQKALNEAQIFPRRYFYPSLNTLNYVGEIKMPVFESIAERILCLPLYYDLPIEKLELIEGIAKAKHYSYRQASIFLKQLSSERYAVLQEKLYKFPGFFVQTRTLRKYPFKSAAHALGYLREVTNQEIKSDPYFRQGDYIGKSGIERTYEKELRGEKGVKIYWVDVFNRIKGSFRNGKFDEKAVSGKNLHTSLDIDLQQYGELLMQNKKGCIVAIEPATGEILALISSPSYDPNLMVGKKNIQKFALFAEYHQAIFFVEE